MVRNKKGALNGSFKAPETQTHWVMLDLISKLLILLRELLQELLLRELLLQLSFLLL